MEVFTVTLKQMVVLFIMILLGFILRKSKILPENSGSVMSRLEMYLFVPALSLSNWLQKCNVETFTANSPLILYGLLFVLMEIMFAYPLSALFVRKHKTSTELAYQRNIYKYAMSFSNHGFLGNALILGVWGSDMFFKYSMFCYFIGLICSTWGLFILMPKTEQKPTVMSFVKRLLTPAILVIPIGMIGGFLNATKYIPDFAMTTMSNLAACMSPVAMILAGFVIGGYNLKEIVGYKKVYVATFMRLIVIPSVILIILNLLKAEKDIMILALVAFASPLGLNTIVYPATYGCDTKTGASMTMISSTLAVITIPLMYLAFIA